MRPSIRIDRDVAIPMRDRVVLRGDVWRPDDEVPRPAILRRMPYNKATAPPVSDFFRVEDCLDAGAPRPTSSPTTRPIPCPRWAGV